MSFIIRELAEEFKDQFECLGENTEKYITFSVPIEKENDKTIAYKTKFIDTCLKLIIKIAKNAWKEKKLDQNVNLLG